MVVTGGGKKVNFRMFTIGDKKSLRRITHS